MLWRSVDNPRDLTVLCRRRWKRCPIGTATTCLRRKSMPRWWRICARAQENRSIGHVGIRLNYEISGARSLFNSSGAAGRRPRSAIQGSADRRPPALGRDAYLAHHQARGPAPNGRATTSPASTCATTPTANIVQAAAAPAHLSRRCSGARSSCRSPSRGMTLLLGFPIAYLLATLPLRYFQPADDPRAAAVLDVAPGAHDGLDRAPAAAGRRQRHRWSAFGIISQRRPAADDPQLPSAPSSR